MFPPARVIVSPARQSMLEVNVVIVQRISLMWTGEMSLFLRADHLEDPPASPTILLG